MNQIVGGTVLQISALFETMTSSPAVRFTTNGSDRFSVTTEVWRKGTGKPLEVGAARDMWTQSVLRMLNDYYISKGVIESISVSLRQPFGVRITLDRSVAERNSAEEIMTTIFEVLGRECGGRLQRV